MPCRPRLLYLSFNQVEMKQRRVLKCLEVVLAGTMRKTNAQTNNHEVVVGWFMERVHLYINIPCFGLIVLFDALSPHRPSLHIGGSSGQHDTPY
jgi:hypothetical protein